MKDRKEGTYMDHKSQNGRSDDTPRRPEVTARYPESTARYPESTARSPEVTARFPGNTSRSQEGAARSRQETRPPKRKKHGGLIIVLILIVGVLSAGYLLFRHFYGLMNYQPVTESASSSADVNTAANDNVFNILLLGNDSRAEDTSGRTDTMILVSINKETKKIVLTSFMRDMYLYIPGYDGYQRLNAANVYGGVSMTEATIEQNFNIHIDRYVEVDFYTFIDAVNTLGGVDVTLTDDDIEEMNLKMQEVNSYMYNHDDAHLYDDNISSGAGDYHLDGAQTLAYCRLRYVDDDFGRTQRQRDVLGQLWNEAKSSSPVKTYRLMKNVLPQVTSDLKGGECLKLLFSMLRMKNYELVSQRVPASGTFSDKVIDDMDVLSVDLPANITILQNAIYGD
jgi:LCP family protein required for cell wall assembly